VDVGNIFAIAKDVTKENVLIVDDTMTEKNVSEDEAKDLLRHEIILSAGQSGDWNKIQQFAKLPSSTTIISKISMKNYNEKAFDNFFFPKFDGTRPFKHVALYKFGKLHNAEAFLVLSNLSYLPQTGSLHLQYMAASIAIAMGSANMFLARCSREALPSGLFPRQELSAMWLKLTKSLPTSWPWYQRTYDATVKYGSEIIGSADGKDIFSLLPDQAVEDLYDWVDDVDDSLRHLEVRSRGRAYYDPFTKATYNIPNDVFDAAFKANEEPELGQAVDGIVSKYLKNLVATQRT